MGQDEKTGLTEEEKDNLAEGLAGDGCFLIIFFIIIIAVGWVIISNI